MRVLAVAVGAFAFAAPALAGTNLTTGEAVFKAKCGSCHTLQAAGTVATSSTPGQVLTDLGVKYARVMKEIYGSGGAMPEMADVLTQQQINEVVAYVIKATAPPPKNNTTKKVTK